MIDEEIHSSPIWRPYTQMKTAPLPLKVVKGKGQLLKQNGDRYAGIVIEPLVQGSAGMRLCRPQFLQALEQQHRRYIEKWLQGHPRLEQLRTCGTIAAMEVKTDSQSGYFNSISSILRARFLDEGFLLRPLGNTLYIMPPYCITEGELESIYQAIRSVEDTL